MECNDFTVEPQSIKRTSVSVVLGITIDIYFFRLFAPVIVKYMEKNLLLVPWPFVIYRSSTAHNYVLVLWYTKLS